MTNLICSSTFTNFFFANWKIILIIIVSLMIVSFLLNIISKTFKIGISFFQIITFPFRLIWKILKVPIKALTIAKVERNSEEKKRKDNT